MRLHEHICTNFHKIAALNMTVVTFWWLTAASFSRKYGEESKVDSPLQSILRYCQKCVKNNPQLQRTTNSIHPAIVESNMYSIGG